MTLSEMEFQMMSPYLTRPVSDGIPDDESVFNMTLSQMEFQMMSLCLT